MKLAQSLLVSFTFLLVLSSSLSFAESINLDDLCYDCPSDEEETESIFPPFNLTIESFDSDLIAQFIEDLPEDLCIDEQEEDEEEPNLPDYLEILI